MARALLMNQTYFYENTEVDENVDYKLIRATVWDAQELYIKDILGSPLYDVITAEIISNNGSLTTGRLVTLVNTYVAPCLLKYVMMDLQVPLLYKFRNKSTLTDRTDFSNPIDFKEMTFLRDFYRIKAENYAKKIERYICANSSTFPEYSTYTSSDEVRAQRQQSTVSLFLGGELTPRKTGFDYPDV